MKKASKTNILSMGTFAAVALGALAMVPSMTFAKGINCQGSRICDSQDPSVLSDIVSSIVPVTPNAPWTGLDPDRFFHNGEHILCEDSINGALGKVCAFVQGSPTGGAWGFEIIAIAKSLVDHNCKKCGSVPIGYPGNNDNSRGELTINYVAE